MNNIFQSSEWERFKLCTGYQKSYWIDDILVLQKNLPFGYSMLYSPRVAERQRGRETERELSEQIKKIAKENNSIFYRLELDIAKNEPSHSATPPLRPFQKSFEEMQPEHTLTLDLTKSEEELLSQMKQKGRYNIKVAQKNEIKIHFGTGQDDIDDFYKLYEQTGKRHRITYRDKSYFEKLVEILSEKGYCRVYTAQKSISGKKIILSAMIVVYSGKTAIYMFGASNDEYKNMMAPYLLQWTAIQDSKAEKYINYDFFGIAPDDNPRHPWAGVTRFKRQFGGGLVQIEGSYDLILKPVAYQLFKIAEKIRR